MISLERLLDGLDVAVEPLVVSDFRRLPPASGSRHNGGRGNGRARAQSATIKVAPKGLGVVELSGGATVRLSPHALVIQGPPVARGGVDAGARTQKRLPPAERATKDPSDDDPYVVLASGRIHATYQGGVSLFDKMHEPLVESLTTQDPIRRSFKEAMEEIVARRPGFRAMVEAQLRRCLILVFRRYAGRGERRLSWLAEVDDHGLGRALSAMREKPAHPYTLRGLAQLAGMSRSVFAARFAETLGKSPMEFLKALRLARAAQLLMRTDLPVKTVAGRVGYSSRSSFSRAFLDRHRVGPMEFRAAAREPALRPAMNGPPVTRRKKRLKVRRASRPASAPPRREVPS